MCVQKEMFKRYINVHSHLYVSIKRTRQINRNEDTGRRQVGRQQVENTFVFIWVCRKRHTGEIENIKIVSQSENHHVYASRHNDFCTNNEHIQSNHHFWTHKRVWNWNSSKKSRLVSCVHYLDFIQRTVSPSLPHLRYQADFRNHLSLEQHPKLQISASVLLGEVKSQKLEGCSQWQYQGVFQGSFITSPTLRLTQQKYNLSETHSETSNILECLHGYPAPSQPSYQMANLSFSSRKILELQCSSSFPE